MTKPPNVLAAELRESATVIHPLSPSIAQTMNDCADVITRQDLRIRKDYKPSDVAARLDQIRLQCLELKQMAGPRTTFDFVELVDSIGDQIDRCDNCGEQHDWTFEDRVCNNCMDQWMQEDNDYRSRMDSGL